MVDDAITDKEQVREADDIEIEPVPVPEWGGTVYVRGLTGSERDQWEAEFVKASKGMIEAEVDGRVQKMNMENSRARLVARCCVDSEDPNTAERIFDDEDIEWLGEKSGKALDRVYEKARELSGISEEDVEEMAESLGNGRSGGSGSD